MRKAYRYPCARNRQKPFGVFLAKKRLAGGNPAQHRHFAGGIQNRFAQSVGNFDRQYPNPANVALFLQDFQMIGDTVNRGDLKLLADLGDRWRETLLANRLKEEFVDRLLPAGQCESI